MYYLYAVVRSANTIYRGAEMDNRTTNLKKTHVIHEEIRAFLIDRKTRQLSPQTIDFYSYQLDLFDRWASRAGIKTMEELTPDSIRSHLLDLGKTRNPGGIHASWRALKVFLRWWEKEVEPPDWRNPISKVQPPKIRHDPLPGISKEHFSALLNTCDRSILGLRDRAIFLLLLDTGVRQSECCALDVGDVNFDTGVVIVRKGKGSKTRSVFLGVKARRELIRYLRKRGGLKPTDPLFATRWGGRLSPDGLRQVVVNRSKKAGIPCPGLHDFRRAFAIQSLRNNADVLSIARQLGHSSTHMVWRYARQNLDDLRDVHDRSSPVDNL